MDEKTLRRAVRDGLSDTSIPSFEIVTGARAKRRVRRLRMAAALLIIVFGATAPFVLRPPRPEPEFALLAPPTTDWLLQSSDPAWVEQLDHDKNEER